MFKMLFLSDTLGHLELINELVEKTQANIVVHAGNFGFHDHNSYFNLSPRELFY